jgi:RNA polymerase sigma-70 factor (ECF subfamily)
VSEKAVLMCIVSKSKERQKQQSLRRKVGIHMLLTNETEKTVDISHQRIQVSGVTFAVIDRYKDLVYRTALTAVGNFADAEDIMQEVFFKYFRQHPAFETDEHEKAWLLRVTINEGKNLLRSAWHRKRSDVDLTQLSPAEDTNEGSEVLQAVLELPEKYRIAIYLHYFENYAIREIASITSQSESAVSQQLTRGRKKLQKKLGGEVV